METMNLSQLALETTIGRAALVRMVQDGRIASIRDGKRILVPFSEVERIKKIISENGYQPLKGRRLPIFFGRKPGWGLDGKHRRPWATQDHELSPVRKAMLAAGDTLATASAKIRTGISIAHLSNVLRGRHALSDELALKIEEIYGVSFEISKRWHAMRHKEFYRQGRKMKKPLGSQ